MARSLKKVDKRTPKKPQQKLRKRSSSNFSADDQSALSVLDGDMKNVIREAFLKRP